ncbi:hypothetical protein [Ralstonia pseudosolanacearum]|uniref:hypothetical protein n=1 Tax=Ralstonia pseudosolanacearum TaxID=1310165 RepID=UPI001E4B3FFA|nr:hypothetical protein [Ralstonia pseudosolanacearum]
MRLVVAEVRRLQRATGKRIELDVSAADALSERSDIDLHATLRFVQDAFAMRPARTSPCRRYGGVLQLDEVCYEFKEPC